MGLTKDFLPKDASHKHKFRILETIAYDEKTFTTMRCEHCWLFYHVERGWFQHNNRFAKEKV